MDCGSPPNPNRRPRLSPPASTMSNCFIRNGRTAMFETFFGFKKSPFASSPDPKQLFESGAWTQLKARLQFLTDHRGAGLLTGEAGSGKSTAARTWLAGLNPNLVQDHLSALVLGLGSGSIASTGPRSRSRAGSLQGRSRRSDRRSYRASQQDQKAAPDTRLR